MLFVYRFVTAIVTYVYLCYLLYVGFLNDILSEV